MSWVRIVEAYRHLDTAIRAGDPLQEPWQEFCDVVRETREAPPYHLRALVRNLDTCRGSKEPSAVRILDHGCGGGLTLLYFAALGYTNISGVDVGDSICERLNRLTSEILGHGEKRFFVYDGHQLPFEDRSFDFVFSQEVLEHVSPDVLSDYYGEEHRVLVPNGFAMHSVPHRLVPFDSHTRTWFLHWILPREQWIRTLKFFGRDVQTAEAALFLRWPWRHKSLAKQYFGHVEDRTMDRLRDLQDFDYYDGPRRLRQILTFLFQLPVLGGWFGSVLSRFMMMDTVSINRRSLQNSDG